ncbi:unnamed protein product [Paramecium pentaurelia]|uniref:Uncharacterized protein n=1 Tax=Paramecium pentaurelia TaxID=43138 RepID=A0A8S1XQ53_9CILI|nr:unnamed protein product [Paramecium pentaurelia]
MNEGNIKKQKINNMMAILYSVLNTIQSTFFSKPKKIPKIYINHLFTHLIQ